MGLRFHTKFPTIILSEKYILQVGFIRPSENLLEYLENLIEKEENDNFQETMIYTSCSLLSRFENSDRFEKRLLNQIVNSKYCKSVHCQRIVINCLGVMGVDKYFLELVEQIETLQEKESREMAVKLIRFY